MMKNCNLNEINKKELIDINGGSIPSSTMYSIYTFFDRMEEAKRMAAELRSIR